MAQDFFDTIGESLAGVFPLLAKVAPSIATAIGGPLAGTAVQFLENSLGLTSGSGPSAVSAALQSATPEQLAALKKADNDFIVQMKQLDISIDKLDYDDRASARARESNVHDKTPMVLAITLTSGYFLFLAALLFHAAPTDNQRALDLILGGLTTAWIQAMAYYFGSTSGSRNKDYLLYSSSPAGANVKP